jgi:ABC-type transport system involved in multi-copper enzyme maturation permease subunit
LADVRRLQEIYQPTKSINQIPQSLATIEVCREAATMIMLAAVALLAASTWRPRWAAFLWAFAFWDLAYYAGLWATIRWPMSFKDLDVLFLIPVPWTAQVWFPILVSLLSLLVIALSCWREGRRSTNAFVVPDS